MDWQTGSIKTATFTAVSGEGYFANTSGGVFNITLPASPSAGDIVAVKDYGLSFQTNNLTVDRNGSNINGSGATNPVLSTEGQSVVFVYVDATKGWVPTQDDSSTIQAATPSYMAATGGTETTCGNCKIHTFTGPGTLTVTAVGNSLGSDKLGYMVVAGGGGGASGPSGGGGGGGGFREAKGTNVCYSASPLAAPASITLTAPTAIPITVGGGGSGGNGGPEACNSTQGTNGSNSIFSTITSAGGGRGQGTSSNPCGGAAGNGGSGGGAGGTAGAFGSGNTPTVSPAQGFDGEDRYTAGSPSGGGGGGGATSSSGNTNADGGTGATTSISATPTAYAGGGGSGASGSTCIGSTPRSPLGGGNGGTGGGGSGSRGAPTPGSAPNGGAGSANTGGGGGGAGRRSSVENYDGGAGGSGIVIIRYKFQ